MRARRPISLDALADGLAATAGARPGGATGCRVVAVDGWSGSGKTSLAGRLAPAIGAPCVHLDDFVPGWDGLARSVELLVTWILEPLAAGQAAGWRCWDWDGGSFGDWHRLAPADLVVVEGCGAGAARARPWLSGLVWLDVGETERSRRLRARPDWAGYEPWADMWAAEERALRAGDDVAGAADAVVTTDASDRLLASWRT